MYNKIFLMYKVLKEKQTKIVIEKSKFFGLIYPCNSINQQKEILKEVKRQNLSATHICHASLIYQNALITPSFSDDKEPSGTAGSQILQALKEQELVNALCVVVRCFGGIKLGVAGLGRAYKESAVSTIVDNKEPVTLKTNCKIITTFNNFDKIKSYLQQKNINIISPQYASEITFNAFLNEEEQSYINTLAQVELTKEQNYF